MKKVFLFLMMLIASLVTSAQNVVKKGKNFVQQPVERQLQKKDNPVRTDYMFTTSNGDTYPIYVSSKGKAFIKRISKNGNEYKQYLPEITKELEESGAIEKLRRTYQP